MTKEEIERRIRECAAENEELKTHIAKNEKEIAILREELNRPEYGGKRWKPKHGERYCCLVSSGHVTSYVWYDADSDNDTLAIGNVFPTYEAAEFEAERRKVIAELSDYAEGEDAVWDMVQCHYMLYYDSTTDCIEVGFNQSLRDGNIFFPSRGAARAAIEAVGEERVKKYYLGVRE